MPKTIKTKQEMLDLIELFAFIIENLIYKEKRNLSLSRTPFHAIDLPKISIGEYISRFIRLKLTETDSYYHACLFGSIY